MKKYIFIAMIVFASILSSCGDEFLRLYPTTDVVAGAPATRGVIDQNVTGAYQILLFDCYANSQWMPVTMFFDALADDFYTGGADANDQAHLQRAAIFEAHPEINAVTGWWSIFYSGIKRTNGALNAIENAVEGTATPAWLAERTAEMLTLRAYYTHWLWKAYGNIPYFTDIWTEAPFVARQHSFDELYPIMLADLDAAINTPEFPLTRQRTGTDTADRGRVSKAMAMMTRARIVMYYKDQSRYVQVLQDMQTIINDPMFSLVTAIPNNADNFTGRLGGNNGALAPATTNWFEWIFLSGDPGSGQGVTAGSTANRVGGGEFSSESIFEVVSNTNNGKAWDAAWTGFGNYTPRFTAPRAAPAAPNNYFASGWGFMPIRPEAFLIFEDGDVRRDATISRFPAGSGFQDTGYYQRKYAARFAYNAGTGGARDLNWTNNKRIFRIAEAYLNAAELSLAVGGGNPQQYLDAIRDRAFGNQNNRIPATLGNIKLERRREFMGEGLRFWDLLRWGADELGRPLSEVLSTSNEHQTRTWTERSRFLPIPQSDINRVRESIYPLTQNPGYTN